MGLTKEQEAVRDTRGKNMLVSAAAGSGKTFVLVERIISEILDDKNGIDVDQILVVTFTTAAAAEMRDRIRRAIDKAILTKGADARIRSQATLIHSAHIQTIDSFCNWVVKNYFYEIDLDPSFRIGQAGELKMLSDNVFTDLLSSYLERDDEDFRLLADAYISGRNVESLKKMVFALHDKALSFAWADEWYDDALRLYDFETKEDLASSEALNEIMVNTDIKLRGLVNQAKRIFNLYTEDCNSKDKEIFTYEIRQLEAVLEATTFDEKKAALCGTDFSTRWGTKGTCLTEDDIARARAIRDDYKKAVKKIIETDYAVNLEDLYEDLLVIKRQAKALIAFTKEYTKALSEEKRRRNIFDFNDIEHMALEILREKDSKEHEKRAVALELSQHFKEIMVDEYQDSNELQEQILTAVSNGTNYFTVGDVKQSIYAFRQASPALFIDKLYNYPKDDSGDSLEIDLDMNFRSRGQVLDFCNQVFAPLMQMDVGGVKYDEKAALKVGDDTFKGEPSDYESEILIATQNKAVMEELEIENADELEALVIAQKIKSLYENKFEVSEKGADGRELRPMRLSDIVILMRGVKGHSDKFISVLKDCGIPAYVAEETGFFDRDEIQTVLACLSIIDNPQNDIPLAASLHSPMFEFSSERLAEIRAFEPKVPLYDCLVDFAKEKDAEDVKAFLATLEHFREASVDTPIHDLLLMLIKETGFDIYTKSLPNGRMASANLDKLVDEAVRFESTSFKGLSRFVSYIDSLQTYDEDLGLAKTVGENDEAVRIMTIHKSKGLEYPVVFVAGCGRTMRDGAGDICYDDKLGLALKYRNPITKVYYDTPLYGAVKSRMKADDRGEFLRIMYVALTRAVDKLILTAAVAPSKDVSVADKIAGFTGDEEVLDTYTKLSATTPIELIIRALNTSGAPYKKHIVDCEDLFIDEVQKAIVKEQVKAAIEKMIEDTDVVEDNPVTATLSFVYDGLKDSAYKSKYSVSEIKHQAMEEAFAFNDDAAPAFINNEKEAYVPAFARVLEEQAEQSEQSEQSKESKVPAGALYGTAMHRFLECYDFARADFAESFNEQLDYMKQIKRLSEEEFARIGYKKLKGFLQDDAARRMSAAAQQNKLYKEKPFVFGSNASDLFGDKDASDELILVQGIIDVFWEEEDGLVLLDYKTDRVDEEGDLVLRYEKQLQLYKDAIEKAYEQPVKEVLIYSFALERSFALCTTK